MGKEERDEGGGSGGGGQHASGTHHQNGIAGRLDAAVSFEQPVAHGDRQLHGIGEAEHHDQRDHDVEEQIELEAEPAEQPERPDDGDDRGEGRDQHQREAPEEGVGDHRSEQEAEGVVEVAVVLDRVPDLELHHRRAGELHLERRVLQIFFRRVVDLLNDGIQALALDDLAIER